MEQTVDVLFINAHVLTMDENLHQYSPGAVAVKGDSIVSIGYEKDLKSKFIASETIDCDGKILMPGLINAHTHVPMTLLRGLADDLRLDVWLLGYIMPVEREFVSSDFVQLGTKLACAELARSGVTCFADMYYFEDDVALATSQAGLRAVCSQTVLKFPTPDAKSYEDSLAYARDFIRRWKGHPLIEPSVAPHAPYTCTNEILQATSLLAQEFDVPLHTHLSETVLEVENIRRETGMPVIPYVKKQGLFDAKVLAAHCVHIDPGEIRTLAHAGAGIAHNPSSNLKLGSGIAPVLQMLEAGLNVGIGTDGPASNNDLDMFEEVRLTAFLAKGTCGDPTVIPAATALTMATRLGAKAMHLGHLTGSLEPGKRADLILIDINPIHNSPRFNREPDNAYSSIVYAAKSTDVTDVMVNGNWVLRNRNLLTLDQKDLLYHAAQYAKRIDSFLIQREQSVYSKLIALGGSSESESFEIQIKVKIADNSATLKALQNSQIDILYHKHYHQHDAYFIFSDPSQGRLRYREDEFIDEKGQIINVRSRLTLLGPARESNLKNDVLLSRSRYLAPATNSLRFYREYFKPSSEILVDKDRLRWLVKYKNTEFYINLDTFEKPALGIFLEIKSRTWSLRDAENKARLTSELITLLEGSLDKTITQDYIEVIQDQNTGKP
ncbi:MAG: amidohydrolase [Chloroflexi bacterium GWB2_49_20]|nr:MAG: amidohydrolase [Chloroflexi bacterium GWB2_49_20]OGN79982.1 MAG: amidohydrolase [Chloroflexi bacterium GWC2_49_37]OGN85482.1 MAG: amidohydrolase [Chloroflexi bacterium GWD2_49_16]HBG74350.1 amidohydrolase [Anaerolineae bacterium]HCM97040.1 amidohydrolase [Anaerolineae bacterium]